VPAKAEDIVKDFPLWLAKVRDNDPLLLAIDAQALWDAPTERRY